MAQSKAMGFMIERKDIMREIKAARRAGDKAKQKELRAKADELYHKAMQAGGLTPEEAHLLAMVH